MVLALAERLGVPLRQRNRLLLAGGYAPAYSEQGLAAPPASMVQQAIALILAKQEPYPAVVLDRFWSLVDANQAYRRMLGLLLRGRAPAALEQGGGRVNLMLTVFDPAGLWPSIENARRSGATCCAASGRNCRYRRTTAPRARYSSASPSGILTWSGRAACRYSTMRLAKACRRRCCRWWWRGRASMRPCFPR